VIKYFDPVSTEEVGITLNVIVGSGGLAFAEITDVVDWGMFCFSSVE
jgi:hypothetical protein